MIEIGLLLSAYESGLFHRLDCKITNCSIGTMKAVDVYRGSTLLRFTIQTVSQSLILINIVAANIVAVH